MFDKKRFIASEDSINIAYKLPRREDQRTSREPMMVKLMKTKALSEDRKMTLIQRFGSNAKKEFFGILKFRLFSDVTVQLLVLEENHEVISLRIQTVFKRQSRGGGYSHKQTSVCWKTESGECVPGECLVCQSFQLDSTEISFSLPLTHRKRMRRRNLSKKIQPR